VAKKPAKAESSSSEDEAPKKKPTPAKKPAKAESSSSEDEPAPKKKPAPAKKPAKKAASSSSEDEAPKKPAKKAAKKAASSSESEEEAPKKSAKKAKKAESSSSEDEAPAKPATDTLKRDNKQEAFATPAKTPKFEGETELFVGSMSWDATEDDIYNLFSKHGEVFEVKLLKDFEGRSRGRAFVKFATPE